MASFAKFPVYREPWVDCAICGESYPRSQVVRHYKKGFLVDALCADDHSHDDNLARIIRGRERPDPSEQVVKKQGQGGTIHP